MPHFLTGHCVAEVQLILRPVSLYNTFSPFLSESFLAYVQHFNIVTQLNPAFSPSHHGPYPDPASGMYLLKCLIQANGQMGNIIPVKQI